VGRRASIDAVEKLRIQYTYIHTHIHACMHKYTHTYKHTYMHAYIRTYTCMHTYIHICMHTYAHIHAYIHIYIRTYIHKRSQAQAHVVLCEREAQRMVHNFGRMTGKVRSHGVEMNALERPLEDVPRASAPSLKPCVNLERRDYWRCTVEWSGQIV
jgi:hypothetical protein